MNTKLKSGLLAVVLAMTGSFLSCNKILEVDQPDNLVHSEFWQNRDQVYASLVGLYTSIQSNASSFHVWGDIRSALYKPGSGDAFTADHRQFLSQDLYPDNGLLSWSSVYKSIGWINTFIKNAPLALSADPTFKEPELNSMLGEAHALRALNYFYLVRAFREVPLIKEPYESDNQQVNTAATSESEVLDFIESDLEAALNQCPDTFDDADKKYGRVTKNAVRALWADVKLWRNDYQGVLNLCAPLDQQYESLLVGPFEWYTLFNPGNSPESIFELQYKPTGPASPLYGWFAYYSGPATAGTMYLANSVNVQLANEEVLYPTTLPEYTSSDTIRYKDFSAYRRSSNVSGSFGSGWEVYKFLGQEAYQQSYRPPNDRRLVNYILYRYREILFMKAEAYAMLNRYPEAEQMLNLIRQHCNIPLLSTGESGEGAEFFSRLLMEREAELGFEGKEWFAAVRIARRPGFADVLLTKSATNNSMGYSYQVIRARLLNPESWFLPYNKTEIENNPSLVQKEYYKNR
ncbi:RagB/SusD family nutrient uptake outer membrane protein [Niabella beijingensis]|uniref:RagB/SusD family nutrient uptake outer membrane protein n=1 Tax=Niabella beijingensis TaxID=2872700 RepID=UPI001CC1B95D|nr:RagB/SusD family nutrient uptake outer membrane protein [Niabella beijingensis]MBZ4192452.1 RagB/SusD family nutrient uptake outer membrane protein [Niabella beijingensis]